MRLSLINKVIAPFLLVVFTITSCNVFVMPEPDTITVPIGKGDIRFFYLDEDYNPTSTDIGKMAMYVENNELTKDVLVLAEIRNDNIDNDVVVRVMNKQNNSLVSFFYFRGQYFPHKVVITIDGENIIGQFSLYSPVSETYSVEFTSGDGESESYNDFILNKKVFSLHKKDNALTDTQNVRISHIITTLALWNSLAFQMDDNFKVGGRAIYRAVNWGSIIKIFTVVPVVAVVAAVILADPLIVTIIGAVIPDPITTITTVAVTLETVAVVEGIISLFDEPEQKEPPENPDRRPKIEITLELFKINEEITLENNGMTTYYFPYKGDLLTFKLKLTYLPSILSLSVLPIDIGVIKGKFINWFDPNYKTFIESEKYNAVYFKVDKEGNFKNENDVVNIIVSKENEGSFNNGKVQLVLKFGMDVIINGKGDGIDFYDDNNKPVEGRKDIFVINLCTKAP